MRWSLAILATGLVTLLLDRPALTEDKPPIVEGPVVIDVNKLPPEVAKRLLDELAKQQKPAAAAVADKARDGEKPKEGEARGEDRRKKMAAAGKGKAEEKPSKGKVGAKKPEVNKKPEK
jgi:hypothetical protein